MCAITRTNNIYVVLYGRNYDGPDGTRGAGAACGQSGQWTHERGGLRPYFGRCAGSDPLVNELFKQGVGMGAIWYGGHLDPEGEENGEN